MEGSKEGKPCPDEIFCYLSIRLLFRRQGQKPCPGFGSQPEWASRTRPLLVDEKSQGTVSCGEA